MKNKQVMEAFQYQLPLINECRQHLERNEIQFALSIIASIWADVYLVLSGQQALLLTRLIDEVAPEHAESVIPATDESNQETPGFAVATQTARTSIRLTFDDWIPYGKIEKFLADVDEAVDAARDSSRSLGNKGTD